jgi:hypothetical protein
MEHQWRTDSEKPEQRLRHYHFHINKAVKMANAKEEQMHQYAWGLC